MGKVIVCPALKRQAAGGPLAVIGLTGKAGAGKSTAAEGLEQSHGFVRIRFADPLKNMLRSLYRDAGLEAGEIERRIEGDLKERPCEILCGRTPRQAMQWLGTEWGRELVGEDFWTGLWQRRASAHARVVAEDCRFANEEKALRALGGKIAEISRPGLQSTSAGSHKSEAGGLNADARIVNDGDKATLWQRLERIADAMVGGF